jgi:hypothetical protein
MLQSGDNPSGAAFQLSRWEIVRWWEVRRIRYNLLVGVTWVLSLILMVFVGSMAVKPGDDFEEPMGLIFFSIAFAITANICYTSGWIVDLVRYRGEPSRKLFGFGLIFSIVLAMLPALWAVCAWLFTVHSGKKLD